MIVVDSSVWISHFGNVLHPEVVRLRDMETPEEIVVGDLILMEVLRGARSERDAGAIERRLRLFAVRQMLDEQTAIMAARHYRFLRGRGVTVRGTVDLVIATFCIANGHHLLHRDRDFDAFEQNLGLRVLR